MSAGHHSKEAYCDTMLMPLKSDSSPHLSYTSSGVEGGGERSGPVVQIFYSISRRDTFNCDTSCKRDAFLSHI